MSVRSENDALEDFTIHTHLTLIYIDQSARQSVCHSSSFLYRCPCPVARDCESRVSGIIISCATDSLYERLAPSIPVLDQLEQISRPQLSQILTRFAYQNFRDDGLQVS